MTNSRIFERAALLESLTPTSVNNTTVATGYVTPAVIANFGRLYAVVQIAGVDTGTVTAAFVKASDDVGTGAAVALTSQTLVDGDADESVILLEFDTSKADKAKPYLALKVTVGNCTTTVAAALFGTDARYEPAEAFNSAAVADIAY